MLRLVQRRGLLRLLEGLDTCFISSLVIVVVGLIAVRNRLLIYI